MKKIIALLICSIVGISSIFAYTNIITLGLKGSAPSSIYGTTIPDESGLKEESASFKFNSTNLQVGYIGALENGLTFKACTAFGLGSAVTDCRAVKSFKNEKMLNFAISEFVGLGYAFINRENLFLALYGNLGTDFNLAFATKVGSDELSIATVFSSAFLAGADLTVVYTPKSVFSIFASLSAEVGFSIMPVGIAEKDNTEPLYSRVFLSKPFVQLNPTIGISWKF